MNDPEQEDLECLNARCSAVTKRALIENPPILAGFGTFHLLYYNEKDFAHVHIEIWLFLAQEIICQE